MLHNKLLTNEYYHEHLFYFNGQPYYVHSIVRLTEYGRQYLGARKRDAILTEHFKYRDGRPCWTYHFIGNSWNYYTTTATTDVPPEQLIEKILCKAGDMYCLREEFIRQGIPVPKYENAVTITTKDWDIPEVRQGWIMWILSWFVIILFKDWYMKSLLFAISSIIFGMYRETYKNAYTCYQYPEDEKIKQLKQKVLFDIKEIEDDE